MGRTDEFTPEERGFARDMLARYATEIAANDVERTAALERETLRAAAWAAVDARQARLRADAAATGGYGTQEYADLISVGDPEVTALVTAARSI